MWRITFKRKVPEHGHQKTDLYKISDIAVNAAVLADLLFVVHGRKEKRNGVQLSTERTTCPACIVSQDASRRAGFALVVWQKVWGH
jgi:hypothetical protein